MKRVCFSFVPTPDMNVVDNKILEYIEVYSSSSSIHSIGKSINHIIAHLRRIGHFNN